MTETDKMLTLLLLTMSTISKSEDIMPRCDAEGYHPYPGSCTKFLRCTALWGPGVNRELQQFVFQCAEGTVFDPSLSVCNWPSVVEGCGESGDMEETVEGVTEEIEEENTVDVITEEMTEGNIVEEVTEGMEGGNIAEIQEEFTEENNVEEVTEDMEGGNITEEIKEETTEGNVVEEVTEEVTEGNIEEDIDEENEDEEEEDSEEITTFLPAPGSSHQCSFPGIERNEENCSKFWLCKETKKGEGLLEALLYRCPEGYLFSSPKLRCRKAEEVSCPIVSVEEDVFRTIPFVQLREEQLDLFFMKWGV